MRFRGSGSRRSCSITTHSRPRPPARTLAKALRLAVQRNVFTLDTAQMTAVSSGITQFAEQVQIHDHGGFVHAHGPRPAADPRLEVALGHARDLGRRGRPTSWTSRPASPAWPCRPSATSRGVSTWVTFRPGGQLRDHADPPRPAPERKPRPHSRRRRLRRRPRRGLERDEYQPADRDSDRVEGVDVGSGVSSDLGTSRYASGISSLLGLRRQRLRARVRDRGWLQHGDPAGECVRLDPLGSSQLIIHDGREPSPWRLTCRWGASWRS